MSRLLTVRRADFVPLVVRCARNFAATSNAGEPGEPGVSDKQIKTNPVSDSEKSADKIKAERLKELITNNPDRLIHWEYHQDLSKSKIYDKKPMKIQATEGRIYLW